MPSKKVLLHKDFRNGCYNAAKILKYLCGEHFLAYIQLAEEVGILKAISFKYNNPGTQNL